MDVENRSSYRIIILSLVVLILPMIVFPRQLGTELAKPSLVNVFYELVFYGLVVFIFNRQVRLTQLAQAAGVCLVYRLAIGAVFGILIAAMYSLQLSVSMTLGLSSYLPAILFQIALTPLILKPALARFYPTVEHRRGLESDSASASGGETVLAASREARRRPRPTMRTEPAAGVQATHQSSAASAEPPSPVFAPGANGFDRATRYLAEDASVQLACVVDEDGLLLSNFRRGELDPDDVSPLALLFIEQNSSVLKRGRMSQPERVDLQVENTRVMVAREHGWYLMVVADRQSEEFLNIRFAQSIDIVRKYMDQRYPQESEPKVENIHVSST